MSARGSFQTDERRPLAMVDTDTIDYFDDIGGKWCTNMTFSFLFST